MYTLLFDDYIPECNVFLLRVTRPSFVLSLPRHALRICNSWKVWPARLYLDLLSVYLNIRKILIAWACLLGRTSNELQTISWGIYLCSNQALVIGPRSHVHKKCILYSVILWKFLNYISLLNYKTISYIRRSYDNFYCTNSDYSSTIAIAIRRTI